LINNWTDAQKYIYHVLRLIKSDIVERCGGEENTVLCTYFFKTLMLWTCEEKSPEFWTDENLETSIGELLCKMIEWLIERYFPNYFIRTNNMVGYLSHDFDLSTEISSLLSYKEQCLSKLLSNTEKSYPRTELNITVPTKILNLGRLQFFFCNMLNPLDLVTTNKTLDDFALSERLSSAFKTLYTGLSQHLQLMVLKAKGKSTDIDDALLSKANGSFPVSSDVGDASSVSIAISSNDTLLSICEKLSFFNNSRHCKTRIESSRLSRCNRSASGPNINVSTFKIIVSELEAVLNHSSDILVSASYFVSVAYRVNFLYTALHDYSSAIQECENAMTILKNQKTIVSDKNTFRDLFPVVLTDELSPIFDKHIQTVLGFVALCQSVSPNRGSSYVCRNERGIAVRLCSLEFIYYIHRQCSRQLAQHVSPLVLDHYDCLSGFPKKHFAWFSQCFLHAACRSAGQLFQCQD